MAAGIFASARYAPAGGSGTLDLVSNGFDNSNVSSYTFASQSLGAAAADRLIFVCAGTRGNNTISSVSVAGVSASLLAGTTYSAAGQSQIWVASVPTGTTGDVVIGCVGGVTRMMFAAYRATGLSATPIATLASNGGTIATSSGGWLLTNSIVYYSGGTSVCSWSPAIITQDAAQLAEAIINQSVGHGGTTGATETVTASWSLSSDTTFTSAVSLQP